MLSEEEESSLETEIEALKSIYIHELEVNYNEQDRPDSIKVQLYPATADNVTEQYVKLLLVLKLHLQYPHYVPEVLIQNTRGLSDEEIESIHNSLSSLAAERKGTPMLFELIETAKEILTKANTPSCQCAICLYGFAEGDDLIKTECFHYFHSHCLARYVLHVGESFKEMESVSSHQTEDIPKVVCPVCRLPISFSPGDKNYPPPLESEKDKIKISAEVRALQRKMQRLYNVQKKKGGIIDIEAERNKYLLEISNTPDVSFTAEGASTSEIKSVTGWSEEGKEREAKPEFKILDDGGNYPSPYRRYRRCRNSRQSERHRKEETNGTESNSSFSRDESSNSSLECKNRFKVGSDTDNVEDPDECRPVRRRNSFQTSRADRRDFHSRRVSGESENDSRFRRYTEKRNRKETYGGGSCRKGNQSRRSSNRGGRESSSSQVGAPTLTSAENGETDGPVDVVRGDGRDYSRTYQYTKSYYRNKSNLRYNSKRNPRESEDVEARS
ncbi:E3 ubiquitin-protein ligase RNF25-like [Centruroides sculpturatus]|uniref:E3 ubiquitin-protein ligase RNF25-like n=1 Tax=Centruroides sculpturatus TaxID=218467 RepID=UPI000C6DECFF|nr:E3 ubiquitin-protein ligase RNF25-like [Centruroides sculpturatus]XP_023216414.1 E3 ubiquitin-protein ligase RNF25-like [Centruroides sculpturatus]